MREEYNAEAKREYKLRGSSEGPTVTVKTKRETKKYPKALQN